MFLAFEGLGQDEMYYWQGTANVFEGILPFGLLIVDGEEVKVGVVIQGVEDQYLSNIADGLLSVAQAILEHSLIEEERRGCSLLETLFCQDESLLVLPLEEVGCDLSKLFSGHCYLSNIRTYQ